MAERNVSQNDKDYSTYAYFEMVMNSTTIPDILFDNPKVTYSPYVDFAPKVVTDKHVVRISSGSSSSLHDRRLSARDGLTAY